jgi:hypothetical protein
MMNDDVIEFAAEDRYEIAGRGTAFAGPAPFEMRRDKPEINGRIVRIKGVLYRVVGGERKMPNTRIAAGEDIGLLVRPLAED